MNLNRQIELLENRRLLTIFINATAGDDTHVVDRDGSSGDIFVTLNGTPSTRLVNPGETDVSVSGQGGNDIIDIVDMDSLDLTVNGGSGDDTITIGAGVGTTVQFDATTLTGSGGNDTLIFDDTNRGAPPPPQPPFNQTTTHSYEFDPGTFLAVSTVFPTPGPGRTEVTHAYNTFETVTLDGGASSTEITVGSLVSVSTLNINGGDGIDTLTLDHLTSSATINFNGQNDGDRVVVSDEGAGGVAGDIYTLDSATFDKPGLGILNFLSVTSVSLSTPDAGADVFMLGSAAGVTTTLSGGAGDDVFLVGDGDFDNTIGARARVDGNGGNDFLSIDDSTDAGNDGYSLIDEPFENFRKSNMAFGLEYDDFEELSVNCNAAGNAINVSGVSSGLGTLNISASGGNDTMTIPPLSATVINLNGGTHTTADVLTFQNAAGAGSATFVSGVYDFESAGDVTITAIETFPLPPVPPSVPDLSADDDSGISFTDNITNRTQLTFSGTALVNHGVLLRTGSTALGSATASAGGAWTIEASALTDGTHPIAAAAREPLSGLTGVYSAPLNVTVDTIAPPTPTVAPDLNTGSDTGFDNTDNVTRDNTPQFDGAVPANHIVRLFVDGILTASDTTTPSGTWSIVTPVLADGSRQIVTKFEDLAGNESSLSPTLNITIDTVAPAAPTVAPDMTAASDTGVSSTDNITRDATPTFVGTRPTGIVARLVEGMFIFGNDFNTTATTYSITPTTLDDGGYDFSVQFQDVAGNNSPFGPALSLTIDTVAPTLTVPAAFNFLTSQNLTYQFSEDVGPTFSTTDLTLDNLTTLTAIPAGSMSVSYTPHTARVTFPGFTNGTLPDGDYRATLSATGITDLAGNPLSATAPFNFFFLNGDANRDRRVNLADFNILAANFGQSPRDFSRGDFNYDTIVNLADFNILASRFGNFIGPDDSMQSSTRSLPSLRSRLPILLAFSDIPIRPQLDTAK